MQTRLIQTPNGPVAVIHSDTPLIVDGPSALDFAMNAGARLIAINKEAITEGFFRLSTGIAGEVAQKFVNYRIRLAVYGDFSRYTSGPLRDYIRECNRGGHLCFVDTERAAIDRLGGCNAQ